MYFIEKIMKDNTILFFTDKSKKGFWSKFFDCAKMFYAYNDAVDFLNYCRNELIKDDGAIYVLCRCE